MSAPPNLFARTPAPPYHAVIFSSQRSPGDEGYGAMADKMIALAGSQPGYLGIESVRGPDGFGITVSYWRDQESLLAWKANLAHLVAQRRGKAEWYQHYELRVAMVERAYDGPEGR